MGIFKQIKDGISSGLSGEGPSPDALAAATPEQRAAYEAQLARAAAEDVQVHAGFEEAKALSEAARVLDGPAGDKLHGPGLTDEHSPEAIQRRLASEGMGAVVKGMWKQQMSGFGDALKDTVGGGKVPEVTDPQERVRVSMAERAARDAARAPYLAPQVPPIAFSRLATRGGTQIEELSAWLQQSGLVDRPDRVYGVYRVPDRISPTLTSHSEKGRVVEWDVVHEPGAATGASPTEVDDAWFPSRQQWVARRVGEPSILDEDLGIAYCRMAGLGPERCLGIARHSEFVRASWGESEHDNPRTQVVGVHVLHPDGAGGDTLSRLAGQAPIPLGPDVLAGVHTEVLNVDAVEAVVHPRPQDPVPVPSPFAYLPSTPQELLRMYLEVVGIRASDCYGAQVTVHANREIFGRMGAGQTNVGPRQPCADGEERMRISAAEHVVVTHRDRPEYADGRQRWAAYQQAVLQAHLERGTGARAAVWVDDLRDIDSGLLRAGATLLRGVDRIMMLGEGGPPPPYRYCWPPVEG
ncbi:MAG TPA: hypothetical protein VD926_04620 [Acidimicrobiales bacterium]|nr:hypothetical protein [Acidimicrobiales bacterium]